jgi:hypothetical protein
LPTDKYIHLSPVDPEPNGITRQFAVSDTRLVSGTVRVFLDNEQANLPEWSPSDPYPAHPINPPEPVPEEPKEYIDLVAGRIILEPPDTGSILKVSYYFQWFTDADLLEFLNSGAQLVGYESVAADFPVQHRAPILSFAAHYAYLKMAANSAQSLQAGVGGWTGDNTSEHPNWMSLAEMAWETGKAELEVVSNNPLTALSPAMAFVSFRLQRYVPFT